MENDRPKPEIITIPIVVPAVVENKRLEGRPTVMTPTVLEKLKVAFMYCYTDEEACLYAGISPEAMYDYQKLNPAFTQQKKALKLSPNLKAKKMLVEGIDKDIGQARWWAERKIKEEFQPSAKLEHAGRVEMKEITAEMEREEAELANKYEEELNAIQSKKREEEPKVEALSEAKEEIKNEPMQS